MAEASVDALTWRAVNAAVVARMLLRTPDWFYRKRAWLVAAHGFPEELPSGGYDPVAVDRWRELQMPAALRRGPANDDHALADDWTARLIGRATGNQPPLPNDPPTA